MNDNRAIGVYADKSICKSCKCFGTNMTDNGEIHWCSRWSDADASGDYLRIHVPIGGKHSETASHGGAGRSYTQEIPADCDFKLEQIMKSNPV